MKEPPKYIKKLRSYLEDTLKYVVMIHEIACKLFYIRRPNTRSGNFLTRGPYG